MDSNGLPIKPCGNIKEAQVSGCNLKDVEIEKGSPEEIEKGSPEQLCISDSSKKDIQGASEAAGGCYRRADGSLVCP
jgi:hypothetical protein